MSNNITQLPINNKNKNKNKDKDNDEYDDNINLIKKKEDFRELCNKNLNLIRNISIPDIPKENYYEAFYIEFRIFNHAEYLIRNTILKLPNWAHTVVCGNTNFENITNICNNISRNIRIIKLNIDNLNTSEYSKLLMTKDFWCNFKGEKLLLYQEDSFLFHNKIQPFLNYDYVGAPWPEHQDEHINQKQYGVGNGGFSLRSKSKMIECINRVNWERDLELGKNLIKYMNHTGNYIIPEDVYFSKSLLEKKIGTVAPRNVAINFSQEIIPSVNPLGGHNFYLARNNLSLNIGLINVTNCIGVYSSVPFTFGGGEKYISEIIKFFMNLKYDIFFFNNSKIGVIHSTFNSFSIDFEYIKIYSPNEILTINQKFDYFIEMSNYSVPRIINMIKNTDINQLTYKFIYHCQFPEDIKSINNKTTSRTINNIYNVVSYVIVNSEFTYKHLSLIYKDKIKILYPYCNIESNIHKMNNLINRDNSCMNFITVGRLFPYKKGTNCKNIDILLDIFNHFALMTDLNFKLHIICSIKDKKFYNELLNQYKESITLNKIIFYPDCTDSIKNELLIKSDYYIHNTGIRNTKDMFPMEEEHFGISVIEALSKKCIPIVADRGFPSYLVNNNVNGYKYDNKNELCNIILNILTNKYKDIKKLNTNTVIQNNKQIADKYSDIDIYKSNLLKILFNM